MNYIIFLLFALGFVIFLRGVSIAQGKLGEKLFPKESFLFWQKVSALIYFATLVLGCIIQLWPLVILAALNEFLDFVFYLQPTPRISKIVMYLFLIVNTSFVFYILGRFFYFM